MENLNIHVESVVFKHQSSIFLGGKGSFISSRLLGKGGVLEVEFLRKLGILLSLVGSFLMGISGIMLLSGAAVSSTLAGLSYLFLGAGLFIFMLFYLLVLMWEKKVKLYE